ncbi:MAG: hypothetical protein F6K24_43120 [Okeania sp. SIO2D1]|nr:hypothetical protein [Okeania sp. SIO2D1]
MKCIAIFNQENVVKYFGMSDFPRADVAELSGAEYELSASKGYIKVKIYPLKSQENPENILV